MKIHISKFNGHCFTSDANGRPTSHQTTLDTTTHELVDSNPIYDVYDVRKEFQSQQDVSKQTQSYLYSK